MRVSKLKLVDTEFGTQTRYY